MIDLRYHVYSLAAVFFALAIGIIVGTSFVGKPADTKEIMEVYARNERTFADMQKEMRKQQSDLRSVRGDFSRSEKMCAALVPTTFKDRLRYRNVAIVQTGDYDDLAADLKSLVQSVGAEVTSVTKISPSFDFESPPLVAIALTASGIMPKPDESGRTALLHAIADAIITGRSADKLAALEEKHVVNLSGDYTRWNRNIVIIGGSSTADNHRANLVDVPLIDHLTAQGATVVGCEPLDAASSYVPVWKRTNIATVDNANRACGKVSLICALSGEMAHFGQKRTADYLIPHSLEAAR
ncbi:MAG: copper transporter [Armatimonadetes bacterium]|nr:copper transporter [Armatimonadota bacterium]